MSRHVVRGDMNEVISHARTRACAGWRVVGVTPGSISLACRRFGRLDTIELVPGGPYQNSLCAYREVSL